MHDEITETFDLKTLNLEPHVEQAWYLARALAEGQPINAAHGIKAAAIVGSAFRSGAFSKLSKLFDRLQFPVEPTDEALQKSNSTIRLATNLTVSYRAAVSSRPGSRVWGRDFITIMLLATTDPSLKTVADEAKTSLASLQDEWFKYVTSGKYPGHRPWEAWWRAAGVPLPHERLVLSAEITRHGKTRIVVAQVERAWRLPIDALVLPSTDGSFAQALMDDLDEAVAAKLIEFLVKLNKLMASGGSAFTTLPTELGNQVLRFSPRDRVIIIGARLLGTKSGDLLDNIKPMMHSLVKLAADEGIQRMALPLFDIPAVKIDPVEVAQHMLEALTEVRDFGSLRTITLAVLEEEVVEAARRKFNLLTNNLALPISNDEPAEEDLLDIAPEVHAMAEMLLLRKVQPPLAVGILGGWGSGKSTVMRLMQARMDEIRALPVTKGWEDNTNEGTVSPYAGHVYQIFFNAWTYAKSNLWASLMQRIFFALNEQLAREESLQKDGFSLLDGGPLWKILRDQKQKKRTDLRQTENTLALLKAAHKDAQATRRSSVAHHIARDAVKDKVKAVLKGVYSGVVVDFFEAKGAPDQDKVNEVLDELKSQKKTALKVWKTMGSSWSGFIGLVVCALIGVGGYFLVSWLTSQSTYQQALSWLASVSGAFLPLILIMTRIARVYRRSVDAIVEAYQRSVEKAPMDKRLAERRDKDEKEVQEILANEDLSVTMKETLIQALADKDNLAAYEHRLVQLETRAKGQRQEVGSTANYASLIDFVQARQNEAYYEKKLGLMHQVKADLDELTNGLTLADEDNQNTRIDEDVKAANEAKKKLFPRGEPRVILYIDDLDRCPPNRVVEVMEAVQLLLNTKLFIVVLGLDTRYVTRALEKEYKEILQREGDPSGLDYIEKILQIPYRVRPIEPDGLARFLAQQMDLVGSGSTGDGGSGDGGSGDGDNGSGDGDNGSGDGDNGSGDGDNGSGDGTKSGSGTGGTGSVPKELPPETVRFLPEDRLDMTACCQQVNLTPRSIKRLVNVLKLIKIFWFRKQEGDEPRPVKQTVIGLLALSAAYPEIMGEAFVQLDVMYRDPDKGGLKIIDFLSDFPLLGSAWQLNRFRADVNALQRVKMDAEAEPLAFCNITLAELTVSTFNLVRSFSFVGDPSYTTVGQAEAPPDETDDGIPI